MGLSPTYLLANSLSSSRIEARPRTRPFNKARAQASKAGLLDLGTLPSVKHASPDELLIGVFNKLYSTTNYIGQEQGSH